MHAVTLRAAGRRLTKMLSTAEAEGKTAEALALRLAIESINYRLDYENKEQQARVNNDRIDAVLHQLVGL